MPRSGTRPSPSRLREALFDILQFEPRASFLDLYSGSGAIGLEAASRGWRVACVDRSEDAAAVIRRNAKRADLDVEVLTEDAVAVAASSPGAWGVVFAAPPYPIDLSAAFQSILDAGPAAPGGLYVFQHPSRETPALHLGRSLAAGREKRYGSNALSLIRRLRAADGDAADAYPDASGA